MELTPGGKILAAGIINITGYPNTLNLVRFIQEGSVDSAFNISVGIEEKERPALHFRLFPNPASEKVSIRFSNSFEGNIVLYDISGRKLHEKYLNNSVHSYSVAVNKLTRGIYIIKASKSNGRVSSRKLVLE